MNVWNKTFTVACNGEGTIYYIDYCSTIMINSVFTTLWIFVYMLLYRENKVVLDYQVTRDQLDLP